MNTIAQRNNLELSKTAFFLCDIQEKFEPAIENFTDIVEVAKRLVNLIIYFKNYVMII